MFYKRWLQFEHHIPNSSEWKFPHGPVELSEVKFVATLPLTAHHASDDTWSWSSSWSDQSSKVPRISEFLEQIVKWEFRLINFIQLQCTNIKSSIILFINPTWYKIFFETVKNPFQLLKRHKNDAKILIF